MSRRTSYEPGRGRSAIAGASVVYHAAQPAYETWVGNFERLNAAVADAAAAAGARLVFCDNLYMYGPGASPMREDTPQRATDRKGRLSGSRLAADLLARHARGELDVVIGRSSDYFGPHGENTGAGERVFGAIIAGKTAAAGAPSTQPHSLSYLPDLARAMVVLGDCDEAAGPRLAPAGDGPDDRPGVHRAGYAVAGMPVRRAWTGRSR